MLFAKSGITAGVANFKGGRTVVRHQHAVESDVNAKIDVDHQLKEKAEAYSRLLYHAQGLAREPRPSTRCQKLTKVLRQSGHQSTPNQTS